VRRRATRAGLKPWHVHFAHSACCDAPDARVQLVFVAAGARGAARHVCVRGLRCTAV
jgi:hypothetical protein